MSPDDMTRIRGTNYQTARDNVIFELGLFIGGLGYEQIFLIIPSGCEDLHLPTDLLGITPAFFNPNRQDKNLRAALGPACNQIRKSIKSLETRPYDEEIYEKFQILQDKARQLLIESIANSNRASEFANRAEIATMSLKNLSDIVVLVNVDIPNQTMLLLGRVGSALEMTGKSTPWEQQLMRQNLSKLEDQLADWESDPLLTMWPKLLNAVKEKESPMLHAFLKEASPISISDDCLTIDFLPRFNWFREQVQEPESRKAIESQLLELMGKPISLKIKESQ